MRETIPDLPSEGIARARELFDTLTGQLTELRPQDRPSLAKRVTALTHARSADPAARRRAEEEIVVLRRTREALEQDLAREQSLRGQAQEHLREAEARMEQTRVRTEATVLTLQQENASLAGRLAEASAQSDQMQRDFQRIRLQAEAAVPLGRQVDWLEEENLALRRKLVCAERTLETAAKIAERVASLQGEIDRLGSHYLHAQEEAKEAKAARDRVEDELARVVDRFLAASPTPVGGSTRELTEARDLIREVSGRMQTPPTLPE